MYMKLQINICNSIGKKHFMCIKETEAYYILINWSTSVFLFSSMYAERMNKKKSESIVSMISNSKFYFHHMYYAKL